MTMDDNSAKPVPAANTAPKQRGRPFAKGESGNPAGKPKGARHRTTILLETLMEDEAEAITGAVIDLAKGGDLTAARLVLDRILPVRKGRPINLDLPLIKSSEDVATAVAATIQTMCEAEITPNEGSNYLRDAGGTPQNHRNSRA